MRSLRLRLSRMSLQTKLIASYLGVALGAILLVVIITLAVQNYFYSVQRDQLRSEAEYLAEQIGIRYHRLGDSWTNLYPLTYYGPELFVVINANQQSESTQPQISTQFSDSQINTLNSALTMSLQGHETSGSLQDSTTPVRTGEHDLPLFSGIYISVPIYNNAQATSAPIGALLMAQPDKYPTGFSPKDVLGTVTNVLLIAGVIITGIVILFSIFMARRLTRPLVSLTHAAEQMKAGNYDQRVLTPESQDEIGKLSQTFNAMAEKIENDVNELRLQEQLRRDMIANIAHDLVTPLTAVQGYSEALADEVISEPQERQETAQLIGREVQRLRRLVSDMQNMTALESGQMHMELAPLDMRALVDEVLSVIGPECEQAGITLRNEIAKGNPTVLADSDRVTQVLLNLLDNARKHTPREGEISVGASIVVDARAQKWLEVAVRDTGSGIDPADLPFVFDRFFRTDRARTGANRGSGLGLSIVKAIIMAHGGIIRAESTPGEGTKIAFTLRVVEGMAVIQSEQHSATR